MDVVCSNCKRTLCPNFTIQNSVRVALECKCGERANHYVAQDGSLTERKPVRYKPPAYFESLENDTATLRESAQALKELRVLYDSTGERIHALNQMRIPVMDRERTRVMREVMGSRVMTTAGGDPVKAIELVLSRMDPDSAAELLQSIMARMQS